MDEQTKETDQGKDEPTGTEEAGSKPQTTDDAVTQNAAAERLEKANEKTEELVNRQEAVAAQNKLHGETEAGSKPVKKTEDEKWAEGAKERYEGTGMDPTPDKGETTYS